VEMGISAGLSVHSLLLCVIIDMSRSHPLLVIDRIAGEIIRFVASMCVRCACMSVRLSVCVLVCLFVCGCSPV